jgi:hypothetical protein
MRTLLRTDIATFLSDRKQFKNPGLLHAYPVRSIYRASL